MRILFLSRWFPYPPDNGSRIRVYNVLRELARRHEVRLLTFSEGATRVPPEAVAALRAVCADVQPIPYEPYQPWRGRAMAGFLKPRPRSLVDTYSPAMAAAVRRQVEHARPHLLITSELDMMPYAAAAPGVPALIEELEVSTQRDAAVEQTRGLHQLRARLTWWKLSTYLRQTVPRFRGCTVVSSREADHLHRLLPEYRQVTVIPNAIDLDHYGDNFGAAVPGSLVYSGALTYAANLDAARYLLRDIFPLVAQRLPGTSLQITGSTEGVPLNSLPQRPGIRYTGYVADIRPVVARSWVCVVPLRIGGGTRLKILEAMALGTPVVATRKGAEGLDVTHGEDILIADTPADFARAVSNVLTSPALRDHLAKGGQRLVRSKYNWAAVGNRLLHVVERAA